MVDRPLTDLWKPALFTAGVVGVSFTAGAIAKQERLEGERRNFWSLPRKQNSGQADWRNWESWGWGHKVVAGIVATNVGVFALWQLPAARSFMYRYFASSYYGQRLLSPMLLSVFSHSAPLHLALNMYVLYTFCPNLVERFLGPEMFLALYLGSGVVSSFAGHAFRAATKSRTFSVGASGAILACLMYSCAKMPDSRLQIVFLPFFTFSAAQGICGILALDAAGLLFRWRFFDHAAHLGGSLAGLSYAWFGERVFQNHLRPRILATWKSIKRSPPNDS